MNWGVRLAILRFVVFAAQVVANDLRRQLTGVCVVAHFPSSRIVPST